MRDFESQDFEVTCSSDFRMRIVGDPATRFVKLKSRNGSGNKDGQDAAAEEAIRANIGMSVRKLQEYLASLNIERGTTWILRRGRG